MLELGREGTGRLTTTEMLLGLLSFTFMAPKVVYSIAVSVDNLSLFPFDLIMYIHIA